MKVESDNTDYEVVLIDNEVELKKKIGTSVNGIDAEAGNRTGDFIYTLSGSKVNGKSAAKGIYIINGKKVVRPWPSVLTPQGRIWLNYENVYN